MARITAARIPPRDVAKRRRGGIPHVSKETPKILAPARAARQQHNQRAQPKTRQGCSGSQAVNTPALRFGDPRVQALAGALCQTLLAASGITNKSLRALMTGLLHTPYTSGQMTYDLRRLPLTGLIRRIGHTNRYVLTPDGAKVAIFYTKLHTRLLRPLLAADQPQAPAELRSALRTIDHHIEGYITRARLGEAA